MAQAPAPGEQAAAGQRAMQALLGCLGAAQTPPPPPPQPLASSAVGPAAAATQPGPSSGGPPVGGQAGGPAAPLHAAALPGGPALPGHPAPPASPGGPGLAQGAEAGRAAEFRGTAGESGRTNASTRSGPGSERGAPEALRALVGALRDTGHLRAVSAAAAGALSWSGAFDSAPSRLTADPALAPRLQPGLAATQARAWELRGACLGALYDVCVLWAGTSLPLHACVHVKGLLGRRSAA